MGLATVVRRAHHQPGVDLTYIKQTGETNGDAGDQYTGLDRFGRVVDHRWLKTSTGTATDRFQYGYDRDGNRLYRDNLVNAAFGELFTYDDLNQLTSFQRGTLNGTRTGLSGSASRSQSWDFDALGNFDSVTTDGTSQSRAHNRQNEIATVGATSLSYDANGNLTQDQTGQQYGYDAWNRLIQVKNSSGTTLAAYEHDGLGRRVEETVASATRGLYYSAGWQVLEERVSGQAQVQYVWSPVYIDALVLRDRDAESDGTFEERLYAQQDANWNVTGVISSSGVVSFRLVEDPFGRTTFFTSSWDGTTDPGWAYQHQGNRFSDAIQLYHVRNRDYTPSISRWFQLDPIHYRGGDINMYRYVGNRPTNTTDPAGLQLRVGTWNDGPLMIQLLNKLCPEGGWQIVPGSIYSYIRSSKANFCLDKPYRSCQNGPLQGRMVYPGSTHYSRHPISCKCVCDAINANFTIRLYRRSLGGGLAQFNYWGHVDVFIGTNENWAAGGVGDTDPPGGNARRVRFPPWLLLGHELCGHAITGLRHPADATAYTLADPVTIIENDIRREHSTTADNYGERRSDR